MKCSEIIALDELSWICIENFKMSNFHEVMSEQQNHEQQDAPQDERNPKSAEASPKSASRNHRGWRPSS
jgi:hypothetical protein